MAILKKTFGDLVIGDKFDFVDDSHLTWNSFSDPCQRVGTRKYRSLTSGVEYRVGSVKAKVYHVTPWVDSNGDSNA